MGLDIYFREDIANALAATEEAATAVGKYSDSERAEAYLAGWRDALRTLATFFGVALPSRWNVSYPPAALPPPGE